MKQKRQLIDHWVASRGPFLRFLFHFRDKSFFMTTGATLVRYEQPSEGSASPPPDTYKALRKRRVIAMYHLKLTLFLTTLLREIIVLP